MQRFSRIAMSLAAAGLFGASLAAPAFACEFQRSVTASDTSAPLPQVVARNDQAAAKVTPAAGCNVVTSTSIVDGQVVSRTTTEPANCRSAGVGVE